MDVISNKHWIVDKGVRLPSSSEGRETLFLFFSFPPLFLSSSSSVFLSAKKTTSIWNIPLIRLSRLSHFEAIMVMLVLIFHSLLATRLMKLSNRNLLLLLLSLPPSLPPFLLDFFLSYFFIYLFFFFLLLFLLLLLSLFCIWSIPFFGGLPCFFLLLLSHAKEHTRNRMQRFSSNEQNPSPGP